MGNTWSGDHNDDLYTHHYLYPYGVMQNPTQSEMHHRDSERRHIMEKMIDAEKAKHRLIKQEEEEIYYLLT